MKHATLFPFAIAALSTFAASAFADEGMWPFNMVPKANIQKDHGVAIDDAWLDHLRLSSVRFNNGGSGSFVSPTGLVLTNHHVASDCIAKLSTPDHDYMSTGYISQQDGPEIRCPDLELNMLVDIQDVTADVLAAATPGASDAEANDAVKGAMSQIEKACADRTGLRCDVVTLYAGGKYNLYTYKKYTDVRLVFAPEFATAFFGGDPENFTYPRYDLDMAIFRIYENGKSITPKAHLRWNEAGPKENEVVFVSGHPGSTGRMMTMSELAVARDVTYPYALDQLTKERQALLAFGREGTEEAREIHEDIFGIENSYKARFGMHAGLVDAALMKKKEAEEAALRKGIDANPDLKAKYGTAIDDVDKIQKKFAAQYKRFAALEGQPSRSRLLRIAKDLVRLPTELAKPNAKRLREYRDSNLESLKFALFSPAPIYGQVDAILVRTWLERLVRDLGARDPLVVSVLAGRSPSRAAQEIVAGSKLFDLNERRELFAGGEAAIAASNDPAIVLMRTIDPESRQERKLFDDEIEAPMRKAGERIARAVFALKGDSVPPDATFTLRLSVGVVRGYEEHGKAIPWKTDFAGLYAHATGAPPRKLAPRWVEKKGAVRGDVPLNFVSTNDIIGGNSGSPVVDKDGELVGLIFDGNISSLPNRFVYSETTARAVSVDTAGMLEALRNVYGDGALVQELLGR